MIRRLILATTLLFWAAFASAALSTAQLQTLKAAILANPTWNAYPNTGDGNLALAAVLNATAASECWAKRTSLSRHEILTGTSPTGSTFTWAGSAYIGRTQGERDAFREMFNSTGFVNPSLPAIVAAFKDIFSGAGGQSNRDHITAMSRRLTTEAEKLFASGNCQAATPSTLGFEGNITPADLDLARNL